MRLAIPVSFFAASIVGALACSSSTSPATSSAATSSSSSGHSTTSSSSSSGHTTSSSGSATTSSSSGSATTSSGSGSSTSSSSGSPPPGPGASLICASTISDAGVDGGGKNAWETYGAAAFLQVNSNIFANVEAQLATDAGAAGLGGSFGQIGKDGRDGLGDFEANLAATLVYVYGGPPTLTLDGGTYSGITETENLQAEHTGLNITTDEYNYFLTNVVVPALTSAGVPTEDVESCFAPVLTNTAVIGEVVGH